jgi:cell wall-associated NlpC family hydrolase
MNRHGRSRGLRRAMLAAFVVGAATATGLSASPAMAAQLGTDGSGTGLANVSRPQGLDPGGGGQQANDIHAAATSGPRITREEILSRAESWLHPSVPYSQRAYEDGYRTDCSGYVSMAWKTNGNFWTGDLNTIAVAISYDDLRPGDILLYRNWANPVNGSHVVLFDDWTDAVGGDFTIYEQTPPNTVHRLWSQAGYSRRLFRPFRYVNVSDSDEQSRFADIEGNGRVDRRDRSEQ